MGTNPSRIRRSISALSFGSFQVIRLFLTRLTLDVGRHRLSFIALGPKTDPGLPEGVTSCRHTSVWYNLPTRASGRRSRRPCGWPTGPPRSSRQGSASRRCIGRLANMTRCASLRPRMTRPPPPCYWQPTCWVTSARRQCVLSRFPRWIRSWPRCPDQTELILDLRHTFTHFKSATGRTRCGEPGAHFLQARVKRFNLLLQLCDRGSLFLHDA